MVSKKNTSSKLKAQKITYIKRYLHLQFVAQKSEGNTFATFRRARLARADSRRPLAALAERIEEVASPHPWLASHGSGRSSASSPSHRWPLWQQGGRFDATVEAAADFLSFAGAFPVTPW